MHYYNQSFQVIVDGVPVWKMGLIRDPEDQPPEQIQEQVQEGLDKLGLKICRLDPPVPVGGECCAKFKCYKTDANLPDDRNRRYHYAKLGVLELVWT